MLVKIDNEYGDGRERKFKSLVVVCQARLVLPRDVSCGPTYWFSCVDIDLDWYADWASAHVGFVLVSQATLSKAIVLVQNIKVAPEDSVSPCVDKYDSWWFGLHYKCLFIKAKFGSYTLRVKGAT